MTSPCQATAEAEFLPLWVARLEREPATSGRWASAREHMLAICTRGPERQAIPILDLPLPRPKPQGAEWIAAYRHWLEG